MTLDGQEAAQLRRVTDLVRGELGHDLLGMALYGSAVTSGLRPSSDLDLLAVAARPTTETERRLLDMFRAFQYPRWPYIFPPGTPKEPVQIIRGAMRKAFADPEFPVGYKKLMGDPPAPLDGEEPEQAIKELPRDKEVVDLYQKMAGGDPLPTR